MENIPYPGEAGQSNPDMGKGESVSSSPRSLPLMQQPAMSDCSIAHNSSIGSSDFSVRTNRLENRSLSIKAAIEPSRSTSLTSAFRSTLPGVRNSWSVADLPPELPPSSTWVPAEAVLQTDPAPECSNESPILEVNNESHARVVRFESPIPGLNNESHISVRPDEISSKPSPSNISLNASNGTELSYTEITGVVPPREEIYRRQQMQEPRTNDWEVLDFTKTSRARLYNYYITRMEKLRVLCDEGKVRTDLPVRSEEDYALLRAMTRTYGDQRWWTIMIDDLQCPECVSLLKARREGRKSRCRMTWRKFMGKIRRVCLCGDNSHDFVCNHTRTDTNKVTRFFHTLGEKNASRMVNIELDTDPRVRVDTDVLASAVHNVTKYFKDVRKLCIKFHFHETVPVEPERIKGIVCSLKKLEELLPWHGRLVVEGFEAHPECQMAWAKKSRKWWE